MQSFVDDLVSKRSAERILSKEIQMLSTKLTTALMELGYEVEKKHVVGDWVLAILDNVLKCNLTLIVIQIFPQYGNPIDVIANLIFTMFYTFRL